MKEDTKVSMNVGKIVDKSAPWQALTVDTRLNIKDDIQVSKDFDRKVDKK